VSHYTPEYEAGEVIAVRTPAIDPFSKNKTTVAGLVGTIEAYNPALDPRNSAADRATPDHTANFAYLAGAGYVAYVDTDGFAPAGTWTLRMHLYEPDGGYGNVEYGDFTLRL
jgi:hypothetical protein